MRLWIYWEVNVLLYIYSERWEKKHASIFNATKKCVPLTISFHLYFLRISKVWSMLHHGSVGQVQSKECYFKFTHTLLWHFFVVFHQKICVFIIFISFFDEVSNFRNKILTNLKPELMIRNCQWNCMHNIEI